MNHAIAVLKVTDEEITFRDPNDAYERTVPRKDFQIMLDRNRQVTCYKYAEQIGVSTKRAIVVKQEPEPAVAPPAAPLLPPPPPGKERLIRETKKRKAGEGAESDADAGAGTDAGAKRLRVTSS